MEKSLLGKRRRSDQREGLRKGKQYTAHCSLIDYHDRLYIEFLVGRCVCACVYVCKINDVSGQIH